MEFLITESQWQTHFYLFLLGMSSIAPFIGFNLILRVAHKTAELPIDS